jgi:hypothetical protein
MMSARPLQLLIGFLFSKNTLKSATLILRRRSSAVSKEVPVFSGDASPFETDLTVLLRVRLRRCSAR